MQTRITGLLLLGFLLAAGCGRDPLALEVTSQLRVGMSKSEVTELIGERGTLRKEPRGFRYCCERGHSWSPAENPEFPDTCRTCKSPGKPNAEKWYLYRKAPGRERTVRLAMTFDEDEKLKGWAIGDM
jgi:hypothetical protein